MTGRTLPVQALRKAHLDGSLTAPGGIPAANFQPASVDLRFGDHAYRLRASFLPHSQTVRKRIDSYAIERLDLTPGQVLEPGRPYLIPLMESLDLPPDVVGLANPKSSAGRIDTLCRVVSDRSHRFDEIAAGYSGPLYVEIVSRTFPLRVWPGMAFTQLRLSEAGTPAELGEDELRQLHDDYGLVTGVAGKRKARNLVLQAGVELSLDLSGDEQGIVGYRARQNTEVLDANERELNWRRYWEPVYREVDAERVVLQPEEFYLLLSAEALSVPPTVAAEMAPYEVTSGELRTHYAGFFDPGFGFSQSGAQGSRATLEVRAHDVPFMVEQGQRVCRLNYTWLTARPDFLYGHEIGSNYQSQIVTLGKHFTRPTVSPPASQLSLLRHS